MIDPAIAQELDALPFRILIASRRGDGRGRILGTPCLAANETTEHLVVLAHTTCMVLVLAAYTAEELALSPEDADRACAARVNAAIGYTRLRVARLLPSLPARLDRWKGPYGHPVPHAFRDIGNPHAVCDVTHEMPISSYVAKGSTVIDFRDGKHGIRWHRPYATALSSEINHSPMVPRPEPGTPVEVIRDFVPALPTVFPGAAESPQSNLAASG